MKIIPYLIAILIGVGIVDFLFPFGPRVFSNTTDLVMIAIGILLLITGVLIEYSGEVTSEKIGYIIGAIGGTTAILSKYPVFLSVPSKSSAGITDDLGLIFGVILFIIGLSIPIYNRLLLDSRESRQVCQAESKSRIVR